MFITLMSLLLSWEVHVTSISQALTAEGKKLIRMASKSNRIVLIMGAVFLLAVASTVFIIKRNTLSQPQEVTAKWVEANGVATRDEYIRTVRLQDSAGEGHALNEQEVDWLLVFANDPRFQGERQARRRMYASGPFVFTDTKKLSAAERSKVYDFGVSLLLTPDQSDISSNDHILTACRILGNVRDKRAIPLLKPLLNSNDREVRRFAAKALDRLGIEIPPSDEI